MRGYYSVTGGVAVCDLFIQPTFASLGRNPNVNFIRKPSPLSCLPSSHGAYSEHTQTTREASCCSGLSE